MKPDDRKPRLRFEGFRNLGDTTCFQAHKGCHGSAEFNEIPAGNSFPFEFLIKCKALILHK